MATKTAKTDTAKLNALSGFAAPDLFGSAPSIPVPVPGKSKVKDRLTVAIKGLTELAACRSIIDTMKGVAEQFDATVKEAAFAKWIAEAVRLKAQPENFNIVDTHATGGFQVKKKSSASIIPDEIVPTFKSLGIPYENKVITPERFFVPEELVADPQARAELSRVVATSEYLRGKVVLAHQPAVTKPVTVDGTIEAACRALDSNQLLALGQYLVTLAVSTEFDSTEPMDAFKVLSEAGIKLGIPVPKAKKETAKV